METKKAEMKSQMEGKVRMQRDMDRKLLDQQKEQDAVVHDEHKKKLLDIKKRTAELVKLERHNEVKDKKAELK